MTDLEIMRVRMLIAQAGEAGARRHSEAISTYADLVYEIAMYWRGLAPAGSELSPELIEKADKLRESIQP